MSTTNTELMQKFFQNWLRSEEARHWLLEPLPDPVEPEHIRTVNATRTIGEVEGTPCEIYRTLSHGIFGWMWEAALDRTHLRKIWHNNAWRLKLNEGLRSLINTPALESDDPIPPVLVLPMGTCPDTGETWYCYGTVIQSRRGLWCFFPDWFTSKEEAETENSAVVEFFADYRKRKKEDAERDQAERIYYNAYNKAEKVYFSLTYKLFAPALPIEATRVFHGLFNHKHGSAKEMPVADLRTLAAELNQATGIISGLLSYEENRRQDLILEKDLFPRFEKLLTCYGLQHCPFCKEEYSTEAGWLDRVLIYGEALLKSCSCPKDGWNRHKDATERPLQTPRLVRQVAQWGYLQDFLHTTFHSNDSFNSVVIRQVMVGSEVLLSVVATEHNLEWRAGIKINLDLLGKLSDNPSLKTTFHDPLSPVLARHEQAEQQEAEADVVHGGAIKLTFRWSPHECRYEIWSGQTRLYVVHDRYRLRVEAGSTYFCRIKARRDKGHYELVVVHPYLEAQTRTVK